MINKEFEIKKSTKMKNEMEMTNSIKNISINLDEKLYSSHNSNLKENME
jgi:hypothetical protein